MNRTFDNVSGLIFDLDGTISDPSLGIFRCINHALSTHGFSEVDTDSVAAQIGPPLDKIFRTFQPQAEPALISSLISAYRQRYAESGYAENELYAGIPDVLRSLTDRGLRLGVCTSKRRDFAEQILEMFGLISHFSFVDGGEIGIGKHQQLADLLNTGTIDRSAVMIGDRDVDILAAKANGLRSVGVLWGFGDHGELSGAGADIVIREPGGLVKLGI